MTVEVLLAMLDSIGYRERACWQAGRQELENNAVVTFYQRVFLWNLIEFCPHGDIPIYLFVLLLNTRNNLLYSTKFNVNQWL